jgi:hypothetical protein
MRYRCGYRADGRCHAPEGMLAIRDRLLGWELENLGGRRKALGNLGECRVIIAWTCEGIGPRDPDPLGLDEGQMLVRQATIGVQMKVQPGTGRREVA